MAITAQRSSLASGEFVYRLRRGISVTCRLVVIAGLVVLSLVGVLLASRPAAGQQPASQLQADRLFWPQTKACRIECRAEFWRDTSPAEISSLLNSGELDPQARDQDLRTPLHWAAVFGNRESIKLLLSAEEVSPDMRDWRGITPLHLAAQFAADTQTTRALLASEARVQARDQLGDTPLHQAARWSRAAALIELLILAGADVWLPDSFGHSACQILSLRAEQLRSALLTEHCRKPAADEVPGWSGFERSSEQVPDRPGNP